MGKSENMTSVCFRIFSVYDKNRFEYLKKKYIKIAVLYRTRFSTWLQLFFFLTYENYTLFKKMILSKLNGKTLQKKKHNTP